MQLFTGEWVAVSPRVWIPLVFCAPVMIMHLRGFLADRIPMARVGAREKAILAGVMLIATLTLYGRDSDFIYCQF